MRTRREKGIEQLARLPLRFGPERFENQVQQTGPTSFLSAVMGLASRSQDAGRVQ
jgi:hypothetical protein